jgi:DHA1 family inner membrane transport protein
VLLMIGIGLTVGNLLGGRLADRNLLRTLVGGFAGLIAVLVVLFFASRSIVPTLPLLILWGGLAFALVSPLQIWVVDAATDAPNLASTLNQGAFNLGNATGAWLGGVALTAGASYQQLPLLGALVAAIALAFTLTTLVNPRVMPVQIRPAE